MRAVAAIYLLLPQIPMLFMGEEWAATTPFPFFSDYGGELAEAVRRGRVKQLAETGHVDEETLRRAPDPQAESTFLSAKLRWEELNDSPHMRRSSTGIGGFWPSAGNAFCRFWTASNLAEPIRSTPAASSSANGQ